MSTPVTIDFTTLKAEVLLSATVWSLLVTWMLRGLAASRTVPGIAADGDLDSGILTGYIASLEIEGFFDQIGIEPARIFKAEVDHLIAQRTSGQ